jgi:hypothetical protein
MKYEFKGYKELEAAIRRNPGFVVREGREFLEDGLAVYRRGVINNPWRVGGSGGGAPVRTRNLADTHHTEVMGLTGSIYPTASYAPFVHDGTKRVAARPWLDYVQRDKDSQIRALETQFLEKITKDLAS